MTERPRTSPAGSVRPAHPPSPTSQATAIARVRQQLQQQRVEHAAQQQPLSQTMQELGIDLPYAVARLASASAAAASKPVRPSTHVPTKSTDPSNLRRAAWSRPASRGDGGFGPVLSRHPVPAVPRSHTAEPAEQKEAAMFAASHAFYAAAAAASAPVTPAAAYSSPAQSPGPQTPSFARHYAAAAAAAAGSRSNRNSADHLVGGTHAAGALPLQQHLAALRSQLQSTVCNLSGDDSPTTATASSVSLARHHSLAAAALDSLAALGAALGPLGTQLTADLSAVLSPAVWLDPAVSSASTASGTASGPTSFVRLRSQTNRQAVSALQQRVSAGEKLLASLAHDHEQLQKRFERQSQRIAFLEDQAEEQEAEATGAAPLRLRDPMPASSPSVASAVRLGPVISLSRFYTQLDLLSASLVGTDALETQIHDLQSDLYRADVRANALAKDNRNLQAQMESLSSSLREREKAREEEHGSGGGGAFSRTTAAAAEGPSAPSSSSPPTTTTTLRSHRILLQDTEEFRTLFIRYAEATEELKALRHELRTTQLVSESYRARCQRSRDMEDKHNSLVSGLHARIAQLESELADTLRPLTPRPDWSKFPLLGGHGGAQSAYEKRKRREMEEALSGRMHWEMEDEGAAGSPQEGAAALQPGSRARSGRSSPVKFSAKAPTPDLQRLSVSFGESRPSTADAAAVTASASPTSSAAAAARPSFSRQATRIMEPAILESSSPSSGAAQEPPAAASQIEAKAELDDPVSSFDQSATVAPAAPVETDPAAPTSASAAPTIVSPRASRVVPASQVAALLPPGADRHDPPALVLPPLSSSFFPKPPGNDGLVFLAVEQSASDGTAAATAAGTAPTEKTVAPLLDTSGRPVPTSLSEATQSRLWSLYLAYKDCVHSKSALESRAKKVIRALQDELRDAREKLRIAEAFVSDVALERINQVGANAAAVGTVQGGEGNQPTASTAAATVVSSSAAASASAAASDPSVARAGPKYFIGLGLGSEVPQFLRARGKIRNKQLGKREVEATIRNVMAARGDYMREHASSAAAAAASSQAPVPAQSFAPASGVKPPAPSSTPPRVLHLSEFFFQWLRRKFGSMQSLIAEYGYSMIDALDRFKADADCDLFLKMIRGQIHEGAYADQHCLTASMLAMLHRLDTALHGSRACGRLPKPLALYNLRNFFPLKSHKELYELSRALNQDQPGTVVTISKLWAERDAQGGQGAFAERIREAHLAEMEECMIDLQDRVSRLCEAAEESAATEESAGAAGSVAGTVSLDDIRQVWKQLDPDRSLGEIESFIGLALDSDGSSASKDSSSSSAAAAAAKLWSRRVSPGAFFKKLFGRVVVKRKRNFDPDAPLHLPVSTGLRREYLNGGAGSGVGGAGVSTAGPGLAAFDVSSPLSPASAARGLTDVDGSDLLNDPNIFETDGEGGGAAGSLRIRSSADVVGASAGRRGSIQMSVRPTSSLEPMTQASLEAQGLGGEATLEAVAQALAASQPVDSATAGGGGSSLQSPLHSPLGSPLHSGANSRRISALPTSHTHTSSSLGLSERRSSAISLSNGLAALQLPVHPGASNPTPPPIASPQSLRSFSRSSNRSTSTIGTPRSGVARK